MALQDVGFYLTVVLSDTGGNQSTLKYDLTAIDYATAVIDTATIIAALGNVTDAAIIRYSIAHQYHEDTTLFGSGEVENVALVTAKIVGTPLKTVNIRIPAPKAGLFVGAAGPDYNQVDPSDVAVLAYMNLFEASAEALVSDGEAIRDPDVAGNFSGKRIHRGSRKG